MIMLANLRVLFSLLRVHEALPWKARHERRAIYFLYSPAPLA
jgi:hypothetical protein